MTIDLLISNGTIIDGTGQPGYRGDVAISADRIVSTGTFDGPPRQRIDATGLTILPGLIDPHSHADLIFTLPAPEQARLLCGKVTQGITTTIVGNCGLGAAPFSSVATGLMLRELNGWMSPAAVADPWPWRSTADYLDHLAGQGPLINVGTLAPHGPIRIEAMGLAKGRPSPAQLSSMCRALDRALEEGAFGLSTGLIYPPGMYSAPEELHELARIVAGYDRLYTSHIRGSSETLIPAVEELIEVGRQTGVRIHHSHNEAVGRTHWPKIDQVLSIEESAIAAGIRLSFDIFPYNAAATMMIAIYPPWALEGGIPALIERLQHPPTRERIAREIEQYEPTWPPWPDASNGHDGGWPHNLVRATGWGSIRIGYVESPQNQLLQGLSLTQLGKARGQSPFEAISDLIIAEQGQVSMLISEVSGEDGSCEYLERFARHRRCAFCTDAEDYGHGLPHPAAYGAFPRALHRFRDLPIEEIIHRMTLFPARIFGLTDRGLIRPNAFADLILVDTARLEDRASFQNPRAQATGVVTSIINGAVVYQNDKVYRGHGRVLRS